MKKEKVPEFLTERLFMRGIQLKDAESYEKNFADYEVIQHLSHHVPWPYPKGEIVEYLKKRIFPEQGIKRWFWAIFLQEKRDEVIGSVDLCREGRPEHRGFWLAKKHWGKGYMTEAVGPVTNYAFNELGFKKLIFSNAMGNNRSRRVKEKTGAIWIEQRPTKFVSPHYTESEYWELTKESWESYKS